MTARQFQAEYGYQDDADRTKIRPFCAETIKAAAVKCKHCGSAIPA